MVLITCDDIWYFHSEKANNASHCLSHRPYGPLNGVYFTKLSIPSNVKMGGCFSIISMSYGISLQLKLDFFSLRL